MPNEVILDVTPPQGGRGTFSVAMGVSADHTVVSVERGDKDGQAHKYHEIPYGFEKKFPENASIVIVSDGKKLGEVPTDELSAAIKNGNGSILANYATALLNGDGRDFSKFAADEKERLDTARAKANSQGVNEDSLKKYDVTPEQLEKILEKNLEENQRRAASKKEGRPR